MGQDSTSVIDARTTTVGTTTPPSVRRHRRLAVAAAVLALAAGATAWITVGTDSASADRQAPGQARASASAAASPDAAPSSSAAPTAADPSANAVAGSPSSAATGPATAAAPAPAPAGWEPRTFQGLGFSVPPGAVAPDVQDPGNADVPPSFVWTGPAVGDGANAQITVRVFPADQAPALGPEYQSLTVAGAEQAHLRTGAIDSQPPMTAVDVHILAGGRFINVAGMFASGPAGEQMVRDLVASLRIG